MLKNTYKLYIKENYTSENLLKYALKDYANIDKYEIVYNEYGKPYLKRTKTFKIWRYTVDNFLCFML